jgi:WD40 repeat protein
LQYYRIKLILKEMFNLKLYTDLYSTKTTDQKELFKGYKSTEIPANKKRVYSISWNNNGSKLIAGSQDSTIKVYHLPYSIHIAPVDVPAGRHCSLQDN